MNGRFAAYDLESFANNYQANPGSNNAHRQAQQRFMAAAAVAAANAAGGGNNGNNGNNNPCFDDYDPTRLLQPITMATYHPTMGTTTTNSNHHRHNHHAAMMPNTSSSNNNNNNSNNNFSSNNNIAPSLAGLASLPDFEPIPLSKPNNTRRQAAHNAFQAINQVAANMKRPNNIYSSNHMERNNVRSDQIVSAPRVTNEWLDELKLEVPGLSLEPMSGREVVRRLQQKTEDVVTKYLPCVAFLVDCQQDLRKGLAAATQKRIVHHMFRDAMSPQQFYNTYISPLPDRFRRKNKRLMDNATLEKAVQEIHKLCADARGVEHQGCEVMKNTFLGGMKDGESWGLRKWLSKNGAALHICNDCECILHACQKLDRSKDSTRKLSERLRPLAKQALTRLKADIPPTYQEVSTAHPYLPFFHRLESALRGMSNFDPEDDDVICIDDEEEITAMKAKPPTNVAKNDRKRKAEVSVDALPPMQVAGPKDDTGGFSSDDSIIEIIGFKPAAKGSSGSGDKDSIASYLQYLPNFDDNSLANSDCFDDIVETQPKKRKTTAPRTNLDRRQGAVVLANCVDRLAEIFEINQQSRIRPSHIPGGSFWNDGDRYAGALRIFSEILRNPDAASYVERVDEQQFIDEGYPAYSRIIKHPLCFRDIVLSLVVNVDRNDELPVGSDGRLSVPGLSKWNMWHGADLLQAIDLVFLNSLAYGKAADTGRSKERSRTNKLRKMLWAGINKILEVSLGAHDRRKCTPTRRGETSGFVVHKLQH